jgi:hypothetical protein
MMDSNNEQLQALMNAIAPGLASFADVPESLIRDRMIARAEYVALPSSQAAIAKAAAKRERKAKIRLKLR